MAEQYNNELRGSLWKTSAAAEGKAQIENLEFRAYLTTISARADNAPAAIMFFISADKSLCFHAPLWRKKDGKPEHLYNGSLIAALDAEYWVNVFKNSNANPKAPALTISFQEKQPQAGQGYEAPDVEQDQDGIPF